MRVLYVALPHIHACRHSLCLVGQCTLLRSRESTIWAAQQPCSLLVVCGHNDAAPLFVQAHIVGVTRVVQVGDGPCEAAGCVDAHTVRLQGSTVVTQWDGVGHSSELQSVRL
jgi:hypothetical protein